MISWRLPRATSWRLYSRSSSSARITAGAPSRSARVSKSGTTSSRDTGGSVARSTSPVSRASSGTRIRSSGSAVNEPMYEPAARPPTSSGFPAAVEPAGGLDALGHEGELEAQRLVGVPVVVRLVDGREQGAVRFNRGAQLIDWRRERGRHGDSVHELTQRVSVAAEDCVAGAARGGDGDLRRDIGIAVAIAADPVPKPQRHKSGRDRGRSGGGSGGRDCEFVLERPNERVARSSAG